MSNYDPLDRRGRQGAQDEAEKHKRIEREQLAADIAWFMGDPRGRRLMRAWLAFAGVDRVSFDGTSKTYFNEGVRNMGLMLKAQCTEHALEGYITMLREMQPAPKPPK